MKLDFEYGQGLMSAELPDSTEVFIPGKTVADPQCLPQDWDSLYAATLDSLRHPMGMPAAAGAGGSGEDRRHRHSRHRQGRLPAHLPPEGLHHAPAWRSFMPAACEKEDILLLFSNGLHPRSTEAEMRQILGEELFNDFYWTNQITSHDSEDQEHMVDLGTTRRGDPVLMNKYVFDCDIPILIGHTQGNPYGGYSGGYKHCATGITHWRTIATHHVPKVMHRA